MNQRREISFIYTSISLEEVHGEMDKIRAGTPQGGHRNRRLTFRLVSRPLGDFRQLLILGTYFDIAEP